MSTVDHTNSSALGNRTVPPSPTWLVFVRITQQIFSVLVMCTVALAMSYHYLDGYGMALFTFFWTILFLAYNYVTPKVLPHLYFFWAHVAFEATVTIFWLVTFALLADYVSAWDAYRWFRRSHSPPIDATKAAMAFSLLNWLLFCVTLGWTVFVSRKSHSPAVVDGTTHHSTGGFSFNNLFSRHRGAKDVEKGTGGTGPVNETGQPIEMYPNQHTAGPTVQPPPAAYDQGVPQHQQRY